MDKTFGAKVARDGRLVVPKMVRKLLGIAEGGTVVFTVDGNEVRLTSTHQSIKQAQALYHQHAKKHLAVDDFIAERRAEAAREDQA